MADSINLEEIVRSRFSRTKKPVRFFDSGAGNAGVSGDLKRKLGPLVEVTALTLLHPNISEQSKRLSVKAARNVRDYYPFSAGDPELPKISRRFQREQARTIDNARENASIVDRVKVGLLEDMPVKGKYDIVFDHAGPLEHSKYQERVIAQYSKMLPKGGLLITTKRIGSEVAAKYPKVFEMLETTKNHAVVRRK